MTRHDDLTRDYRAAFLRYLSRRDETALHGGYELGRAAVENRTSLLDLVSTHHQLLAEALRETPYDEAPAALGAASEFLVEVLATYDMAQRGLEPAADDTRA